MNTKVILFDKKLIVRKLLVLCNLEAKKFFSRLKIRSIRTSYYDEYLRIRFTVRLKNLEKKNSLKFFFRSFSRESKSEM